MVLYLKYLARNLINLKIGSVLDHTFNTISIVHEISGVTMTDTEVIPVGAICITFFTVAVEKYPQLFCNENKNNFIF